MRASLKPVLGSLLAIILIWALWNGFARGGQDFRVFQYAGRLVLDGRWDALYSEGPDRFLYAPGFALLISPLAAIPAAPALAIWLLATVIAFGSAMRALAKRVGTVPVGFAILFSVRPFVIDLRYGQVNLLILSSAVWALLAWFDREDTRDSRRNLFAAWFIFAIAACAKVYPLALFLFPLFGLSIPALLGAAAGATVLLLPPAFISGTYSQWFDALARKGLPTYTHNQSFLAFLVRVFGGEPFHSLGMGGEAIRFPGLVLSLGTMRAIWILFSLVVLVLVVRLAWRKADTAVRPLVAGLVLGLCFLPAHLIWKSYFVLGIPLLAALFNEAALDAGFRRRILIPGLSLGVFLAFTSGDFVGPRAAAWIEALSPFFWIHLAAVVMGFSRLSFRSRSS